MTANKPTKNFEDLLEDVTSLTPCPRCNLQPIIFDHDRKDGFVICQYCGYVIDLKETRDVK